jgi:hypothetical protein
MVSLQSLEIATLEMAIFERKRHPGSQRIVSAWNWTRYRLAFNLHDLETAIGKEKRKDKRPPALDGNLKHWESNFEKGGKVSVCSVTKLQA